MRTPLKLADLPEEAARFAEEQICAGRFASVDAFVLAATNALKESEMALLLALRTAIDEGDASGIVEGNAFARVRARLGLTPRQPG
jgi:putative addiction module CopG family antidote